MASIIKVDEILDGNGNQFDGSQLGNVGKVLQVQSTTFSGIWSAGGGGTTFYDVTPLNVTITPKSSTSKILIKTTVNIGSGYWEIQGRFTRNGTAVGLGDQRGSRSRCSFLDNRYEAAGGARNSWGAVSSEFLDSPATTSQITYGVALNGYSSYTIGVNYNPHADNDSSDYFGTPISTLTVMEIGA